MKIPEIKPPSKGKVNTYFIAGDWHSLYLNQSSLNIMLDHAYLIPRENRKLIINGDFLDAEHLMAKNESFKTWFKRPDGIDEYFIPLSVEEFKIGNDILDRLATCFDEIIWLDGNHDWRYHWFYSIVSHDYKHNFNLHEKLNLSKRGIKIIIPYNAWLDIGQNLSITHGMYHGTTCVKKHYEASGSKNVIFSHVHSYECKSFQVRGDTRNALSLPAMCNLNPHYIKGRETNWSNGYGIINHRPDDKFNFNVFQIWDDILYLPDGTKLCGK